MGYLYSALGTVLVQNDQQWAVYSTSPTDELIVDQRTGKQYVWVQVDATGKPYVPKQTCKIPGTSCAAKFCAYLGNMPCPQITPVGVKSVLQEIGAGDARYDQSFSAAPATPGAEDVTTRVGAYGGFGGLGLALLLLAGAGGIWLWKRNRR